MRATVSNRLDATCLGLKTAYRVSMSLMTPPAGLPGGLHLEVVRPHAPKAVRHYYFSQDDRIRIGLFLLAGLTLDGLNLKVPKSLTQFGGVYRSSSTEHRP